MDPTPPINSSEPSPFASDSPNALPPIEPAQPANNLNPTPPLSGVQPTEPSSLPPATAVPSSTFQPQVFQPSMSSSNTNPMSPSNLSNTVINPAPIQPNMAFGDASTMPVSPAQPVVGE